MIDLGPPPLIFPKPAITRPAEHSLLRPGAFRPATRAEKRAIIADLVRSKRMTPEEAKRASILVPVAFWRAAGGGGVLDLISTGTLTGAWSMSRALLGSYGGSFYTDVSGAVSTLFDQSGNGYDFTQGTAASRPAVITAGTQSRDAADFDGSNDYLVSTIVSNLFSNSNGYVVISFIANSVGTNSGTAYENDAAWFTGTNPPGTDAGGNFAGTSMRSTPTLYAYNYDGSVDVASLSGFSVGAGTEMVVQWMHTGGNVSGRINLGTAASAASGNTAAMTGSTMIGVNPRSTGPFYADITVFEMVAFSTPPDSGDRDILEQAMLDWIE